MNQGLTARLREYFRKNFEDHVPTLRDELSFLIELERQDAVEQYAQRVAGTMVYIPERRRQEVGLEHAAEPIGGSDFAKQGCDAEGVPLFDTEKFLAEEPKRVIEAFEDRGDRFTTPAVGEEPEQETKANSVPVTQKVTAAHLAARQHWDATKERLEINDGNDWYSCVWSDGLCAWASSRERHVATYHIEPHEVADWRRLPLWSEGLCDPEPEIPVSESEEDDAADLRDVPAGRIVRVTRDLCALYCSCVVQGKSPQAWGGISLQHLPSDLEPTERQFIKGKIAERCKRVLDGAQKYADDGELQMALGYIGAELPRDIGEGFDVNLAECAGVVA